MTIKKNAWPCLAAGLTLVGLTAQGSFCRAAEDPGTPQPGTSERSVTEGSAAGPEKETALGVKEVPRPDGGKDTIYYSVTPESDRRAREQAERDKMEKALDLPRNIILFGH